MKTVKLTSKGLIIDRRTELVIKPTKLFPPSELESPGAPPIHQEKPLSLEEMELAVQVPKQ